MKLAQLSVLAILAVAAQGAFAQSMSSDPRSMGSSMSSPSSGSSTGSAAGGSATDASSVTNVGSAFASDPTTIGTDDGTTVTADVAPTGEMVNTGGEPELMLLVGVLLASGGLLLRRKSALSSL